LNKRRTWPSPSIPKLAQSTDGASVEICAMSKRSAKLNGIHVRERDELLDEIDELRRYEPDIPTRPKAIHRLLKEALAARQRRAGKKGVAERLTHASEIVV